MLFMYVYTSTSLMEVVECYEFYARGFMNNRFLFYSEWSQLSTTQNEYRDKTTVL